MKSLVVGGGRTNIEIMKQLNGSVDFLGYKNYNFKNERFLKKQLNEVNIGEYDFILFPLNGVNQNQITCEFEDDPLKLSKYFLMDAKKHSYIFTGFKTKDLSEMENLSLTKIVPLLEEPFVDLELCTIVVEQLLGNLIVHSNQILKDSNIAILGWNQISQKLVNTLKDLKIYPSIGVLNYAEYLSIEEQLSTPFFVDSIRNKKRHLKDKDIIIDTSHLFHKEDKKIMKPTSYLVTTEELFQKDFSPVTTGMVLSKKIKRTNKRTIFI